MMDRRPIWAMPTWVPDRIREALPADWELVVVDEATDGSGDGATRVAPAVLEAVADATIYSGYGIPGALLEAGSRLRWVHSGAAGVGSSLGPVMRESDVVFTNSAGIHGPPIAETVLAMLLHFGRGLDLARAAQAERRWSTEPYYVAGAPLTELSASTVGIIGFGGIGREIARRVSSLGAKVVAAKRRPVDRAIELRPVAGGGDLSEHVEIVSGPDGLDAILRRSDAIVVTAPDTPATRGLIDADAFRRMKPGCVFINVARGRLVDQAAMVEALEVGQIRGAGLDVFEKEPLPSDSPLWGFPNVVVTPHVSGVTRGYWKRESDLIVRNLERFLQDAPTSEWENVVDKGAGY